MRRLHYLSQMRQAALLLVRAGKARRSLAKEYESLCIADAASGPAFSPTFH